MLCCATLSPLVVQLAVPVFAFTTRAVQPAISLVPSLNVTVPLGWPAPGAVTAMLALSVTSWPYTDGFGDDVTAMVVFALVIASVPAT